MKKVWICTTLVFTFLITMVISASAQSTSEDGSQISVTATGETYVTADLIQFRVNITQFNEDARTAFNTHKEQEQYLTELLIEEDVADSSITANPISISYINRYNNTGQRGYETRQQIMIVLDDVTQFEAMQISLIENGFTNFSGSFSARSLADASDQALQRAVQEAREKAELLAEAAGKEVTDVISISHHSNRTYSSRSSGLEMAAFDASSGSMLQFERSIPVRENVSIQFRIQ